MLLGLAMLTACTSTPTSAPPRQETQVAAGGFRLVAFDSCDEALAGLRSAAQEYVGPWGFDAGVAARTAGGGVADARAATTGGAPDAETAAKTDYSGTNTHESGVDEPDLVKTDGRRIVTVDGGVLRVIDPTARRQTGKLDLAGPDGWTAWAESTLLLHGDQALVLIPHSYPGLRTPDATSEKRPGPAGGIAGARLVLVDLTGAPRVVSEYAVDGDLVDARQVGGTVRVVVRSAPRLEFPHSDKGTERERQEANRKVIAEAPLTAWLPRYAVTTAGTTRTGHVGCDRLIRPESYSGTGLLTVLSFDLAAGGGLGDGDPLTVVADGDTVYSNGNRLYVATDRRWRVVPMAISGRVAPTIEDENTEIHQFDTGAPGRPRYVTSATVPGWLINQYAMSEWDGHLRVATTSGRTWGDKPDSTSAIYLLRADGQSLTETGRITGLGRGERIYAVRFAAGIGYVVTFRETDPLYTVDLSDPKAPRVTGELKITGYSAYLHPVAGGKLLGIGQEASEQGIREGTQISLFDVADLAKPTRLAQHHIRYGHSEAEFDPHAFLYWPADGLLVVPLTVHDGRGDTAGNGGALALRVTDSGFTELGRVAHPTVRDGGVNHQPTIRRSLVIGGVLWTFSAATAQATDAATLDTIGRIRLT
nr:beta-propeller domain-containing protein [Micromonospora sp. DSM 115978]